MGTHDSHIVYEYPQDMILFCKGSHFDIIYPAAEKAGWLNRNVSRVEHVAFGVVLGEDK